ncbi:amidohydrolase, partial [Leucobacter sp. M11]|uniref:amidohydrolase n=1 Tax=Leucobacter sp. M11 TaxID=2993565 RepID=UPI002D808DC2
VRDGRVVATGSAPKMLTLAGPGAASVSLAGFVFPGLIEPHGHPTNAALFLSEYTVDVRPVVVPDADGVIAAIRNRLASRPSTLFVNGWDALLQRGLPAPDRALLDEWSPEIPLVILHNSGHSAYFNSAAARLAGIDERTDDPPGARFLRAADGSLSGVAQETAAVQRVVLAVAAEAEAQLPRLIAEHLAELSGLGYTTVADLGWDPALTPAIGALREQGELPLRLRVYETSRPGGSASVPRGNGDEMLRQIGVKVWSDGSPWVGTIATSFPYLDTAATRALGLEPGHVGEANFSREQLIEIGSGYAPQGWQLACHAHGDLAVSDTLDAYETLIERHGLRDHRMRLEHVGAMTPEQFRRAQSLGVTVSVFVDHLRYWGEVLVDDLFGETRGAAWADAGAAFAAGLRATFHNDGWVTPNEPFQNMAVAETRTSRGGRVLGGGHPVSRADALRAHTVNAAWQLFSEHEVGALAPGRFADFVTLDRDPRTVPADELAQTRVTGTWLAGRRCPVSPGAAGSGPVDSPSDDHRERITL